MRGAITLLIVGSVISTLGAAAVTLYAFRRRARERFLLWFGLFSVLYGTVLVVRNSVFRLAFGQPHSIGLFVDRLINLSTIVPGLLLLEEFYGRGWRSSIRWLIGAYCALAAVAMSGVVSQSRLELIPSPGTMLVILVPVVLALGRLAGYRPPLLANSRVLFTGLLAFFGAFSVDRILHMQFGSCARDRTIWIPGARSLPMVCHRPTGDCGRKTPGLTYRRDAGGHKNSGGDSPLWTSVPRESRDRRAICAYDGRSWRSLCLSGSPAKLHRCIGGRCHGTWSACRAGCIDDQGGGIDAAWPR